MACELHAQRTWAAAASAYSNDRMQTKDFSELVKSEFSGFGYTEDQELRTSGFQDSKIPVCQDFRSWQIQKSIFVRFQTCPISAWVHFSDPELHALRMSLFGAFKLLQVRGRMCPELQRSKLFGIRIL